MSQGNISFEIYDKYRVSPVFRFKKSGQKQTFRASGFKFEIEHKKGGKKPYKRLINNSDSHGDFREVVAIVKKGRGKICINICNKDRFKIECYPKEAFIVTYKLFDYKNDPDYKDVDFD